MGRKVQNQPKEEKKTDQEEIINIRIGVFFDGTSNNKLNIREYRNPNQGQGWLSRKWHGFKRWSSISYKSDFSNVAKLSDFYLQEKKGDEYFGAVYIEGIATAPREKDTDPGGSDSILAAATGRGKYGINGKVERACQKVTEKIQEIILINSINKYKKTACLRLDIFGFSRGAAAARRFVNCIEKESGFTANYQVCLRKKLNQTNLPPVNKIRPCFLGLFDTVSSYGLNLNFEDDVKQLTLGVPKPDMVVQLVAADEYREKFALTRIKTANSKSKELILPGEHCDIGGSHEKTVKEKTILRRESITDHYHGEVYSLPPIYNGYKTLEQLLEEGWIKNKDEEKREISNEYSIIPLLLMYGYLKMNFAQKEFEKKNKVISELNPIKERLDKIETQPLYQFSPTIPEQINPLFKKGDADFVLLKNIRHRYLHLSAQGGLVDNPAKNNIRIIIDDSK
ncbi:hypothetical protein HQ40_07465 [Porphyromonas gulae]|uniref:phospholipase effector Tle1 domain-containing protein n=1 Tax=Porphyromonas gulae TaxID=111105 RepID=UPI00052BBFE2|nr:DUF2235 domain-containing protein [Porphyromonas gulae]KGN74620.1 hypothetical protein HQ40_07465 [Porphyromonas gulae]